MNINSFFTNVLGAHLKNPRWSWGAVDTFSDRVYLRVWHDQIERGTTGERVKIGYAKGKRKSAGFGERNAQIALIESGAEGFGVICVAADAGTTGARKIKRFDDRSLVRFGQITHEGEFTYAAIVDRGRRRTCPATNG